MAKQIASRPDTAVLGRDVQIFQIDTGLAQPGRIAVEIDGVTDRLSVHEAHQGLGGGLGGEQGAGDVVGAGNHFVRGALVDGQFGDESVDLGRIRRGGGADGDIHAGWKLGHRESPHLRRLACGATLA
ncbi:hypothetical protein G6F68_015326 [Rhizopus microsporus]|nr:hypothetical protein G6F68_015326 [Rhizopus microsporus]